MTYEYVCMSCHHEWEAEQSISEDALKDCPRCGKPEAKRQVSGGAGFILKGGGWYADGYGSPKTASKPAEASSASTSKSDDSSKSSDDKASKKSGDTSTPGSDSKKKGVTA